MDAFSFLSVLLSIILGLAITHVLSAVGRLVHNRTHVKVYWPVGVWIVVLLLVYVQSWWASFGLRSHTDWSFLTFLVILIQSIAGYMLAALLLPEYSSERPVDMRVDYYRQAPWFFATIVVATIASVMKDVIIDGRLPETGNFLFQLGFLATGVVGALTKREWFHKIIPVVTLVSFVGYIAMLFAKHK
jgi:hypothetical protein